MSKNFLKVSLLVIAMCFFHGCFFTSRPSIPQKKQVTPTVFEVKHDPNIVFGKLNNGFRYALMKNAYPEDRIAMMLNFDAGSLMEEEHECGLAHFLEHMAFRGSKHFPDGKIKNYMEKLGIAFGHNLNACTGFLNTKYILDLPNDTSETLDTAFLTFRDFCDGLNISESCVDQERGVILTEKRDQDNVSRKLYKKCLKFLLKGTMIPYRLPIGKEKVVKCASSRNLRHLYEKWYVPEKMFLVAVGNIKDVPQFEKKIRTTFSRLKKKSSPKVKVGALEIQNEKFFYFTDKDLSETEIGISTLFPDLLANDNFEARKHSTIISWVLCILQERLQDKRSKNPSLFIGSEAHFSKNIFQTGYSYSGAGISCEHKNWSICLNLLEQEIRKICQYGISAEELQRQKEASFNAAESYLLAAKTRPSCRLASELIRDHCNKTICMSPEDCFALVKVLNECITPEDCQREFRKIWQNFYVSVTTDQPIDNPYSTIEAVFRQSKATPVVPEKCEAVEKFAYDHFETPHRAIIQKKYIEDLDITQITLANDIKVNLKPTNFRENQIKLNLTIGHGTLTDYPHPQLGIFLAAEDTFPYAGLGKNSWEQLNKIMTTKCCSAHFSIGSQGFHVSGFCDKANLLFLLQLIAAHLVDAGFEERALLETHEALKPVYRDRSKSPFSVYGDQYQKFIAGNDFLYGLPDEQSAFSVTMDDIKKLLVPIFQKEAMELTLVGDFALETAIQNIQDTFGTLPKRNPSINTVLDSPILVFPKDVTEQTFFFTGDEKQTMSILTFLTDDENNIQDNRRLKILAKLINNRIFEIIRKKLGQAYAPSVGHAASSFKNFGLFEIIFSLDPNSIDDVKRETLAIIEDLKTKSISQEELDRVKLPLLNTIRDQFKTNSFWLDYIMDAHRRPQDLENLRTRRSFYENITPEDLLITAKKYFNHPIHTTIAKQPQQSAIKEESATDSQQSHENTFVIVSDQSPKQLQQPEIKEESVRATQKDQENSSSIIANESVNSEEDHGDSSPIVSDGSSS